MEYKKRIVFGVFFCLLVSTVIMTGCSNPKKDTSEIKNEMTAYLQNRYQMEFLVEQPKFAGNEGLGSLWYADAHPNDNQELSFSVVQDKNSYTDNYLNQLWTSQGKPEVEAMMKEIYGEDRNLDFYFYYISDQLEANFDELKKLNYSDLISNHGPNLFCIIDYDVFLEEDKLDKQEQAQNVSRFCNEYFNRNNIEKWTLFIHYVNKDYTKEYLERKKAGFKSSDVFKNLYDEKILINILRMHDDELVNVTPEDIIQEFEY